MDNSNWLLIQLCVAGCTGFLIWGLRPVGGERLEQGSPRSTCSRGRENGKSHQR